MNKKDKKSTGFEFILVIISVLLLIPLMLNNNKDYYITFFVFQSSFVIDFFSTELPDGSFFSTWFLFNKWGGVVTCAYSVFSLVYCPFPETIELVVKIFIYCVSLSSIAMIIAWEIITSKGKRSFSKSLEDGINKKQKEEKNNEEK